MGKHEPLKGKGKAIYDSNVDAIVLHFNEDDLRAAVEWLKDSITGDVPFKSGIMVETERQLLEKIDTAFADVAAQKKEKEKK